MTKRSFLRLSFITMAISAIPVFSLSQTLNTDLKESKMNEIYKPLFQEYRLNNDVVIKNRLVVAPMTHFGSDEKGHITDEESEFVGIRAKEFGIFITAATLISPEGKTFIGEPSAIGDDDLDSLRKTANIIKKQGAKAVLQLHHGGLNVLAELQNDKIDPQHR